LQIAQSEFPIQIGSVNLAIEPPALLIAKAMTAPKKEKKVTTDFMIEI
jgi:hypothetical protein